MDIEGSGLAGFPGSCIKNGMVREINADMIEE